MKLLVHFVLLIFFVSVTYSSLYKNVRSNLLSFINSPKNTQLKQSLRTGLNVEVSEPDENDRHFDRDEEEGDDAQATERVAKERKHTAPEEDSNQSEVHLNTKVAIFPPEGKDPYIDPIKAHNSAVTMTNPNLQGDPEDQFKVRMQNDLKDIANAQNKANILRKAKHLDEKLNENNFQKLGNIRKQRYHMDPVLNLLRSANSRRLGSPVLRKKKFNKRSRSWRRKGKVNYRRASGSKQKDDDDSSESASSTREMVDWKDEWAEHWMMKKFEALNGSAPKGDVVNMAAARPWGVQCGDPNQHDMPWGSCMLAAECEPEYRIYRGDLFCGRTEFICCAIQLTNYDLYQGFDVSFDDKSMSTDSSEKRNAGKGSKEKKKKANQKEKNKRKAERDKRKKAIKRNIRRIIKEIRKILDKAYRNGTTQRKKKTKLLKRFVKHLKKQYKKDRQSVKELHKEEIIKIDADLMIRLNQIRAMNHEFMKNATFRDIVVNGTISQSGARMLVEAYPELSNYFHTRRSGIPVNPNNPNDYLDYDIEYGLLYY